MTAVGAAEAAGAALAAVTDVESLWFGTAGLLGSLLYVVVRARSRRDVLRLQTLEDVLLGGALGFVWPLFLPVPVPVEATATTAQKAVVIFLASLLGSTAKRRLLGAVRGARRRS